MVWGRELVTNAEADGKSSFEEEREVIHKQRAADLNRVEPWIPHLHAALAHKEAFRLHWEESKEGGMPWLLQWSTPLVNALRHFAIPFVLGALAYRLYLHHFVL